MTFTERIFIISFISDNRASRLRDKQRTKEFHLWIMNTSLCLSLAERQGQGHVLTSDCHVKRKGKSWICYEDLVLTGTLFCSGFDPKWNSLRIVDNEDFIVSVEFTGLHSQSKSNNIRSWLHELALFALPRQLGKPGPWDCDAGIPVNRAGNLLCNHVGAGDPDQQLDSG